MLFWFSCVPRCQAGDPGLGPRRILDICRLPPVPPTSPESDTLIKGLFRIQYFCLRNFFSDCLVRHSVSSVCINMVVSPSKHETPLSIESFIILLLPILLLSSEKWSVQSLLLMLEVSRICQNILPRQSRFWELKRLCSGQ